MNILDLTAVELGEQIRAGTVTSVEAAEAALEQIERAEPFLHAFISIDREGALARARKVQQQIESGALTGPLAGVPMAVKDNLCVKHQPTTCASKMLSGFRPPYTADAVERLEKAGAVLLGKTNMDEFAMGSTTETSAFGPTKNPWDRSRVPGGSSGGSCAAVAAKECFYALGTDTGGSIRQPSAFCGVTGLKPTYGTVSRYGLIAYGSSLEQIGPIARDVRDCAAVFDVLAAYDKKDSTSVRHKETDFLHTLSGDIRGMRIGILKTDTDCCLDTEIEEAILHAAEVFAEHGAAVEPFSFPLMEYAVFAYYIIASAEASSNLARFDGVKYGYRTAAYAGLHEMVKKSRSEGFGEEVKRRIMLGSFVLSSGYYDAYYLKALKVKALIQQAFAKAFEAYDVLLAPAAPGRAPKLGEALADPIQMYSGDSYTVAVNLAGLPALAIPCGIDHQGMPIGMQVIGNRFQEKTVFRAGRCLEQTRPYQSPGWIKTFAKEREESEKEG